MKIVGLITEYNPFHNGHEYHIQKAKDLTGADAVIVVMSGDFVQRGEPAIMPKHLRAKMALHEGASLVLELPVCFATGSAEQFAYGGVSLLNSLGCVDSICFGSECGDIDSLQKVAKILSDEPDDYRTVLQKYLKSGHSFPAAREMALEEVYPNEHFSNLVKEPNNILGIEYIKALYRLKSAMIPYTIKRISSNYHDEELADIYSSATAIRTCIGEGSFEQLEGQVPDFTLNLLREHRNKRYPIYVNDFSMLLKYRLLNETKASLLDYADMSEELANRIIHQRNLFLSFEQFCDILKTKEVTYSRISRALLHILLDIKKCDCEEIPYARVLGFRKDATNVMKTIKKQGDIPLVTKLSAFSHPMLEKDIYAANLYESVVTDMYKQSFINEYKHPVVRI